MDQETIKQIQEKVDKALLAQGIDPTVGDFNRKLKADLEKQAREKLAEEIKKQVSASIDEMVSNKIQEMTLDNENFKSQVVEAIKSVKIDNQIGVNVPDVIVPDITLPEINVPEPKVTVNVPEIKAPKVEMPKEMEVKGFIGFVKAIFEILKNQLTVKLGGIDRDKPLPVILVDEKGIYYKALQSIVNAGGGGSIMGLMNKAGTIVDPATETKQDSLIAMVSSEAKQDDMISNQDTMITNQESLIEGLITNDAFNGYGLYGVEDDGTNTYVASQNASGKWIIMKIVNATGLATYASGDTDASTNWTNRATLTYEDYATEF